MKKGINHLIIFLILGLLIPVFSFATVTVPNPPPANFQQNIFNTLTEDQQAKYLQLTGDSRSNFNTQYGEVSADQLFAAAGVQPGNQTPTNQSSMSQTQQDQFKQLTLAQQNAYNDAIRKGQTIDQALQTAKSAPASALSPTNDSSWFSWLNPIKWLTSALVMIGGVFQKIMSLILLLAGSILNMVLNITVVNMADKINKMTGINIAWKVVRDLMNIAFIFLLVYEGIKMIVGASSTGAIKKFVFGIVIASVLINFSLYFTKLLIDASNVVTVGFYNSIVGPDSLSSANKGLSNAYTAALNISGFWSAAALPSGQQMDVFILEIGSSILFLIVAFSFFAIAVMFVIRYIILIVLLMTSPIGYMSFALGQIKKYSNQWWEALWGQLLFGPTFMIMTWISVTLINAPGFFDNATKPADFGSVLLGQNQSSLGLLINFAVVIGLIIMTLSVAKSTASKGAKEIGGFVGKATAFAGGAMFGGTAALGRNTVGRLGDTTANSEWLKEKAAKGGIQGKLALATMKAGDKTAKSSFDFRSTGAGKQLGKTSGIDFGKGADKKKVNYQETLKAQTKKAQDEAKMLKPSEVAQNEAKATIKSDEFKQREDKARNDYFNSDAYKNSEQGKRDASALEAKNQYETAQKSVQQSENQKKELAAKRKELEQKRNDPAQRSQAITELINLTDQEEELEAKLKKEKVSLAEFKKKFDERSNDLKQMESERNKWMSDEMKELVAKSGGQKEEKKDGVVIKEAVESLYNQRVQQMADNMEKSAKGWKTFFGSAVSPVFHNTTLSASDKKLVASKVREVTKEKKKPTKENIKELFGVDIDEGEKPEEKKEEKPKEESKSEEPAKTS